MKDGKFLVDREEIYRANLYKKPAIYIKVYIYLLDHAKFKTSSKHKYERGKVYLEQGLNTIVADLSTRVDKVSYEEIYKVVRYFVRLQVISYPRANGIKSINVTGYDSSQSLKSKKSRLVVATQNEIREIATQKRL